MCNLGSVYNADNSSNCSMPQEGRFQYITTGTPAYTAIPCYCNHTYNDAGRYQYPSLDSSGRSYSIINSGWYYYTACNTAVAGTD